MQTHYTAEVKAGLLLKLPIEATGLHLKPGDKVRISLDCVGTLENPVVQGV